jgi:hypothetical protein
MVCLVRENFYFDELCLPTQCCRYGTVKKNPRNYQSSLLVKINVKMGGVNHTLANRAPEADAPPDSEKAVFQNPPNSISWIFDVPTMVVVSHLL